MSTPHPGPKGPRISQLSRIYLRILILTLSLLGLSAQAQLSDGIVGYWPLGSDFVEGSANGADGTFSGTASASFAPAKLGNGIDLDGVDQ